MAVRLVSVCAVCLQKNNIVGRRAVKGKAVVGYQEGGSVDVAGHSLHAQ